MAAPVLRQSAANSVAKGASRRCTVTFDRPTAENSFIALVVTQSGGYPVTAPAPSGFTRSKTEGTPQLHVTLFTREAAPTMNSVTVTTPRDLALHVRAFEFTGARQSGALDKAVTKVPPHFHSDDDIDTGSTGTTVQADETVVAVVINRYPSTVQQAFVGGFQRLFDDTTPQYYGRYGRNSDSERHRVTFHQLLTTTIGSFRLRGRLSSVREMLALIFTVRGGTSGPARLVSRGGPPVLTVGGSGSVAQLSAFGPMRATLVPPVLLGQGATATMLPFAFQFRLNGLLVGSGTRYDVRSHDGLYGYDMRTSDDDQPRGDGAQRGVDLQSARQMLFSIEVAGTEDEVEQLVGVLHRALRPQRDTDWEMVWRHPSQVARMLRCRPVNMPRDVDDTRTKVAVQQVQLRAADPRHYSAVPRQVVVPVTPDGLEPVIVTARNAGNIAAHPIITMIGPTSGPPVTRVELVNASGGVTFDVSLTLPPGGVLVGDMDARVTGAPRSVITLDGAAKYGSWQLPRVPFHLEPDPYAVAGDNEVYLRTTPPGAPVRCVLDYRDTWSG